MVFMLSVSVNFYRVLLSLCHQKEAEENACCSRQTRSRNLGSESGSVAETQEGTSGEATQDAILEATLSTNLFTPLFFDRISHWLSLIITNYNGTVV